jgi:hypothetical protein
MRVISKPKGTGFSSEEITQKLFKFCINCPDPAAAMYLVVECLDPMSPEQLVDRALTYPPRDPSTVPKTELSLTHPLRHMKLDDDA